MGEGGSAIGLYNFYLCFVAETDEVVKETKIIYLTYRLNPVGDGASTSRQRFHAIINCFGSSHPVSLRLPPFPQERAIYYIFLWKRVVEGADPYQVRIFCLKKLYIQTTSHIPSCAKMGVHRGNFLSPMSFVG